MKTGIHSEYFTDAKVICACGAIFTPGGTIKEIHTEVCSACHPFYTGKQKLLDTAGKIDKFRAKVAAAKATGQKAVTISDSVKAAAAKKAVRKSSAVAGDLIVKKMKASAVKAELELAKKAEEKAAAEKPAEEAAK